MALQAAESCLTLHSSPLINDPSNFSSSDATFTIDLGCFVTNQKSCFDLRVTELHHDSNPNSDSIYLIEIEDSSHLLKCTRTVHDLHKFHQSILHAHPNLDILFPKIEHHHHHSMNLLKKHFFKKHFDKKIQKYLLHLMQNSTVNTSTELANFLTPQTHKDEFYQRDSSNSWQEITNISRSSSLEDFTPHQPAKDELSNYELVKVLGKGCMGKVLLVRHIQKSQVFAMKVIPKSLVSQGKEYTHAMAERNIMANITKTNNPYLMKLHSAFQDKDNLYLIMDYCAGGDIATQLARWRYFSEDLVRLYVAEIVLGLEDLHRHKIIYRDLKPENILLNRDGHVCLADFGLSKILKEGKTHAKTFCGTAEYLAPEIISGENYTTSADWWALGTCMYEMFTGALPFAAEDHPTMYRKILEGHVEFSYDINPIAESLIRALLIKDPNRRLGHGFNGAQTIKSHPFFDGINWKLLSHKQIPSPYVPNIQHDFDFSHFDESFLEMPLTLSDNDFHDYHRKPKYFTDMNERFIGYSFSRPNTMFYPLSPPDSDCESLIAFKDF